MSGLPKRFRGDGKEYVRLSDMWGIARWGEPNGRSVAFSEGPTGANGEMEWHVSIHHEPARIGHGLPRVDALMQAVAALIGEGATFELEPHDNPFSLHAYGRRSDA